MHDKIERALRRPSRPSDWLVTIGLWLIGGVAIFTSWSGWIGLAELVGWTQILHVHYPWGGGIDLHASWGFGIAVDIFAAIAVQTWMSTDLMSQHTRDVARNWAVAAIGMGWAANALFHILGSGDEPLPIKVIIVMLSAVPSVMAGVVVHLGVLRANDRRQAPAEEGRDLARREPMLLRAFSAARLVRDSVREFRDEVAPAAQEAESPAQPKARSARPRHRLEVLEGGDSRMSQMRNYYLTQQAAGWPDTNGRGLSGADLDRRFGGSTLGRKVIASLRDEREELTS